MNEERELGNEDRRLTRRQAIAVLGGGLVVASCATTDSETSATLDGSGDGVAAVDDTVGSESTTSSTSSTVPDLDSVDSETITEADADSGVAAELEGEPPLELGIDGPGSSFPVLSRLSWDARPPSGDMQAHDLRYLTLHHTAAAKPDPSDPAAQIRSHQRFHQDDRGWPDIAYHFLIGPAGEIFEGRHYAFAGDTGTDYDPAGHFLVCLDGNYGTEMANEAQLRSAAALFAWAAINFDLSADTLGGHRDYAATQCPGDALYNVLGDGSLRAMMQAILDEGIPQLVYA